MMISQEMMIALSMELTTCRPKVGPTLFHDFSLTPMEPSMVETTAISSSALSAGRVTW